MNERLAKKLMAAALSAVLLLTGTTTVNAESFESDIISYEKEDSEASRALYSAGFELQYVASQAPSGANYPSKSVSFLASGNDYFTLRCTYFNQQLVNFGYLTEEGAIITPVPIYSTGTYKIRYTGTTIPRQGTRIQVHLTENLLSPQQSWGERSKQ